MRPVIPRTDPAPSRLRYRLERMRLTPGYRRLFRLGLPLLMVATERMDHCKMSVR